MACVDLGAELLPSRWGDGDGITLDTGFSPSRGIEKTTLVSMIAGFEVVTRGRDLPGPILSAGFGWVRFRPADERWADHTFRYDVETRLGGEIGAGVNVPIGSASFRLLMHAADFRNDNAEDYEVRWRTRLQVEF